MPELSSCLQPLPKRSLGIRSLSSFPLVRRLSDGINKSRAWLQERPRNKFCLDRGGLHYDGVSTEQLGAQLSPSEVSSSEIILGDQAVFVLEKILSSPSPVQITPNQSASAQTIQQISAPFHIRHITHVRRHGSASIPGWQQPAVERRNLSEAFNVSADMAVSDCMQSKFALPIQKSQNFTVATPERWERDIEYCYDHGAEASCDYRWDRSPMEMGAYDKKFQPPSYYLAAEDCDAHFGSHVDTLHQKSDSATQASLAVSLPEMSSAISSQGVIEQDVIIWAHFSLPRSICWNVTTDRKR